MEEGPVETTQSTDEAQTPSVEAIQSSVEEEGSPLPEKWLYVAHVKNVLRLKLN